MPPPNHRNRRAQPKPNPETGSKPRKQRDSQSAERRVERCGQLAGVDTMEFSHRGQRRYVLTLVDLYSRFGFAVATHLHPSQVARAFLQHVLLVFPTKLEAVLIDKGSRFQGTLLDQFLKESGIRNDAAHPGSPKWNAHAKRFNRTVREEFADFHEELLFADVPSFNNELLGWLMRYNAERPHHSLGYLSPMEFLLRERGVELPEELPESHKIADRFN